mmetsp:Transcript_25247/g.58121  ORF Transcript_25247/g.58121 Transcript_25247/m.58121 type:complete len:236 (-) Transcript_25247:1376-2083(-)
MVDPPVGVLFGLLRLRSLSACACKACVVEFNADFIACNPTATSATTACILSCSRIATAKSMLRAGPFSWDTPTTSSRDVILPSSSPSMSLNKVSTSVVSRSIDANHVLIPLSLMTCRNSSKSRKPSPELSAFANNASILWICVEIAIAFCLTMIRSSVAATFNVSCMNTPLIIPTTAKPMVSLWTSAGMRYNSDTFSTNSRHTGGQFARVISKSDNNAREKVPKYSYTSNFSCME